MRPLEAESVRAIDANPSHLLSSDELASEFAGLSEAKRNDLLKAATARLGRWLGYSLEHRQIFARYRGWGEAMALPISRPSLPWSSDIIGSVQLLDASVDPLVMVSGVSYTLDLAPPPPQVIFAGALPRQANANTLVRLPAEIRFQYLPLAARDSRTLLIKDGLRKLMKEMVDKQDDPLAPGYDWKRTVGSMRVLTP